MVDISQFLTLSSIPLFSENSSIFMIRSYMIFPWTWHWKSMISPDIYKKHCVLRSLEDLSERAEYPTVPCAPPNCSTLCSSPVRQKASENKGERFTLAHWFQKFQTMVPAQPPQACVREDMTVDAHGSGGYWPPSSQEAGRERKVDPKNSILQRHVPATPFPPTRPRLLIAQSVGTHYEASFLTIQSNLQLMNLGWRAHSRSQA